MAATTKIIQYTTTKKGDSLNFVRMDMLPAMNISGPLIGSDMDGGKQDVLA